MQDTFFWGNFQLNIRGNLRQFNSPLVMGILNVTPDSFYAGSRIQDGSELLTQAAMMINEGADILDIGGYSSRPGAEDISTEEEIERTASAIASLHKEFPGTLLSIDTFRSEVAREALRAGAQIVNDISGGKMDDKMFETVAIFKAPYILMHMKGTPQTMKTQVQYDNLILDIQHYFSSQINKAVASGINDIILDPGFGFSKTVEQNFNLMKNLEMFHIHQYPLLAGVSRKSMIYKTLGVSPDEALNGTTVMNTIALSKGASILRVHDVKEAREAVELFKAVRNT